MDVAPSRGPQGLGKGYIAMPPGGGIHAIKIRARLAQDLVGLPKLTVLAFQSLQLCATSVGTPARTPLSRSAFFTHSCSVCAVQPILAAIDETPAQREACSPS